METQSSGPIKAHLVRGAFYLVLLLAVSAVPFAFGQQIRAPSSNKNPNIVCNQGWQPGADMPSPGTLQAMLLTWLSGKVADLTVQAFGAWIILERSSPQAWCANTNS
jgi:hypothetical protein